MQKKYLVILFCIFIFSQHLHAQNPLEDEAAIDLQTWKPVAWQNIGNFSVSPISSKSKFTAGKGIIMANGPAVLTNPTAVSSYLMSFEYLGEQKTQANLQFSGQNALVLSLGEVGLIQTANSRIKPEENAEKTLGLWQKVEVSLEDAPNMSDMVLLNYIKINEVLVHQHVLLPKLGIQKSSISLQLLSGKIAIKNMKFLEQANIQPLKLKNIKAEVWDEFVWETISTANFPSIKKADLEAINHEIGQDHSKKNFIIKYDANMMVDKAGIYNLSFDYAGKYKLLIDNKLVADFKDEFLNRKVISHKLNLNQGSHTFHLEYEKVWLPAALGVFVSGNRAKTYPLHELTSLPENDQGGKIAHNPLINTEIIRGFYVHNGTKNTTAMAVGFPSKYNYAIDVERGNLMTVWKGKFLDITEMWLDRGEPQTFAPEGMQCQLLVSDLLHTSDNKKVDLAFKYYDLDASQSPTFTYGSTTGISFEKNIQVLDNKLKIDLKISNGSNTKAVLAKALNIEKVEKNVYKAGEMFILVNDKLNPEIIKLADAYVLQVPTQNSISYHLAW